MKKHFGHRPIKKAAKPPPYKPSPHGEGGPRQRWIGCFRMQNKCASLSPILPAVFHSIVTLSAPAGHLPLEGKAAIRESHPLNRRHITLVNLSAPQAPSSRAQPRDLYCTAAICTHAPSLKRHLGASFFAFPSPTVYRSSLHFGPHDTQERRIVSHPFFIPLRRVVPLRDTLSCAFGAALLQGSTRIVVMTGNP